MDFFLRRKKTTHCGLAILLAFALYKLRNDYEIISASTAAKTMMTTTPGEPRPQFVLHIHYHKTGNAVTLQYVKAVNHTAKGIARYQSNGRDPNPWIITNQIVHVIKPTNYKKRSLNKTTGCPLPLPILDINIQSKNASSWINAGRHFPATTKPSKINLMKTTAPNFLCNLCENNVFLQNNDASSDGPKHDVKIIHMLRDPFGT
jgi:hypothetical protein